MCFQARESRRISGYYFSLFLVIGEEKRQPEIRRGLCAFQSRFYETLKLS